jgi:glycosyltransferase involved in cell wall biosynthesis/SAM-dependent methyltransferase
MTRRLLVLGSWGTVSPRNRVLSLGLKRLGVESCEIPLSGRLWDRARTLTALSDDLLEWADLVFLPKVAQHNAAAAGWRLRRAQRPLVADYFASLHLSEIVDRRSAPRFSPRAVRARLLDAALARCADHFIVDTAAHRDLLAERYGLSPRLATVIPVGAETVACPPMRPRGPKDFLRVLYVGHYIPLHGVPVILEAARMLRHERVLFTLIGAGQAQAAAESFAVSHGLENLRFLPVISRPALTEYLDRADVVLGIFDDGAKARAVIPKKAYLALASTRCLVTGDTPGAREWLRSGESALLVPPADPGALAEALVSLRDASRMAMRMAENGHRLHLAQFTPERIAARFLHLPAWRESEVIAPSATVQVAAPVETARLAEVERIHVAYERRARRSLGVRYRPLRPAVLLERQQMERGLVRALAREGIESLSDLRILDVGSGGGRLLLQFLALGASASNLCGVDLQMNRLQEGRTRCPSLALLAGDGRRLPFADATFDLTLQCTMLSSVLDDAVRLDLARDMERVTRPGGSIVWYDMRMTRPDNPDVRPVGVREAKRFHPCATVSSRVVTLNPLLSRRAAPTSWLLAEILGAVPWLCGHRITVIRLPGAVASRSDAALHDRRAA